MEVGSKALIEASTITTSVTSVFTVSSDSVATSETVNVTVVESKSSETAPPPQLVSQEVPVTRVVEGGLVTEPAPVTDSANDSTLQEPASDLAECDMTGLFQPSLFDVLILLITTFPCIFLYIDILS